MNASLAIAALVTGCRWGYDDLWLAETVAPGGTATPPTAAPPTAASCSDAVVNGQESDVDCGGPDCPLCEAGLGCLLNSDCSTALCLQGYCRPTSCDDGTLGTGETGLDCGGLACPACSQGAGCTVGADCASRICLTGTCQVSTCTDAVTNGNETDTDCGGDGCPPCGTDSSCETASDCADAVCTSGTCPAPTCTDVTQNAGEPAVDCGGPCGATCDDGESCVVASDCASNACDGAVCVSCVDGIQNGDEASIDCGGSLCVACGGAPECSIGSDCSSGVCTGNVCQAATCADGVQNQGESDIDCGGACGATCGEDDACNGDGDCAGGSCVGGVCDACPSDTDMDGDGICDAADLEQRARVTGVTQLALSPDQSVLFAVSSDYRELRAYDIETSPSINLSLLDAVTAVTGTRLIREVYALTATRAAVSLFEPSNDENRWIRVYELQAGNFTLVENIDTTTNVIYAMHYDGGTDRLYWSNFLTPPVYYYTLGSTPLGFTGLGTSALPFTRRGGYGMHFEGSLLYKVSGYVEIGNLSTNSVVTSWALPSGLGGGTGLNTVTVFNDALLYTTSFGGAHFIMEDVSALPAHSMIADFSLGVPGIQYTQFSVRAPAPVAVVSTQGGSIRVFDLSTLPAAPPAPTTLASSVIDGNTPYGYLDCAAFGCFVSTSGGIYVLAP